MQHPPHLNPDLGSPDPSAGLPFLLVMARATPTSVDELRALQEATRDAPAIPELEVTAIDGFGKVRVLVQFPHPGMPTLLAGLPRLLHALARALPGCKVRAEDPACLLAWTGSRFTMNPSEGTSLPGIRSGYSVPQTAHLCSLLTPTTEYQNPATDCDPTTDILTSIQRSAMPLETAVRGLTQFDERRLKSLVRRGILAPAAQILLDRSEHQGEPPRQPESSSGGAAATAGRLDLGDVTALGRIVLARPGLTDAPPQDADDLVLVDDGEASDDPIDLAFSDLATHPTVVAAHAVPVDNDFAKLVLDRLGGFNDSAAGACMLIGIGAWQPHGIAGLSSCLEKLARDTARPAGLRVLALRAVHAVGRPDALAVIIDHTDDPDPLVAAVAIRLLGRTPGHIARQALRESWSNPDTLQAAFLAAADARDAAAMTLASEHARADDPALRAVIAQTLPRIGGRHALGLLRQLASDSADDVAHQACLSLAAVGDSDDLRRALDREHLDDADEVVRALGDADRADGWETLLSACADAHAGRRVAGARALGTLGLPASTPTLIELLQDDSPDVQLAAIEALASGGDRRAMHALQRVAAKDGPHANDARDAATELEQRQWPPPDTRVRVRVQGSLTEDAKRNLTQLLASEGLSEVSGTQALSYAGSIDPVDVPSLARIAAHIHATATTHPHLRWSVRDGQYAIRRLDGCWMVSGRRGSVVRDAGWFDEPLPSAAGPGSSKSRRALPTPSSPMTPLPVSVVRHVTGREQVVAAADPDRPYTPDEITGDVPVPPVRTAVPENESDDPTGEAASRREPRSDSADSAHITPTQLADDRILSRAPRAAQTADIDPNESIDLSDFLEE